MATDLKELIRLASKNVDTIFAHTGQVLPMYHAVNSKGQNLIIPQPDADKDVAAAMIVALFAEQKIDHYVFLSEAWILETKGAPDMEKIALSGLEHHPDRREIVAFSAESRDGGAQTARRYILRPEHGRAKLSPLVMDEMSGVKSEGRMVGLLTREDKQ